MRGVEDQVERILEVLELVWKCLSWVRILKKQKKKIARGRKG